jgi:membrane-associated phospholipid phosphatase
VLGALDVGLLRLLRTRGHAPGNERAIGVLARCGEHGLLWQAMAVTGLALDPGRRPVYRRAMVTLVTTMAANTAVKYVVRRPRPVLDDLPALTSTMSGRSYPSAHAATSFAAARVLSEALPDAPLYALATLMALTRPYLGVHYPSDIAAGALLGDALARWGAPPR